MQRNPPELKDCDTWRGLLVLVLLLSWVAMPQPALADTVVEPGHSAIWYNPARSG